LLFPVVKIAVYIGRENKAIRKRERERRLRQGVGLR